VTLTRQRVPARGISEGDSIPALTAIGVGILLGAVFPKLAVDIKPIGDGFIMLIRSVAPLIIFATVAVGIAKMGHAPGRCGPTAGDHLFRGGFDLGAARRAGGRQSAAARRRPPYHSNPAGRLHYFRTDSVTDAEFMLLVGTSNGEDIRFQPA
jgi:hypothetical protein